MHHKDCCSYRGVFLALLSPTVIILQLPNKHFTVLICFSCFASWDRCRDCCKCSCEVLFLHGCLFSCLSCTALSHTCSVNVLRKHSQNKLLKGSRHSCSHAFNLITVNSTENTVSSCVEGREHAVLRSARATDTQLIKKENGSSVPLWWSQAAYNISCSPKNIPENKTTIITCELLRMPPL